MAPPSGGPAVETRFYSRGYQASTHQRQWASGVSEIIVLPAELSAQERRSAVEGICEFLDGRCLPYTVGMHLPDPGGDQRNYHSHIIYSLRPFERHGPYDWSFDLGKQGDISTPAGIAERRLQVVEAVNETLRAAGLAKRYTHLSNAARGMPRGQKKMGAEQTWVHRRLDALERREAELVPAIETIERLSAMLADAGADLAEVAAKVIQSLGVKQARLHTSDPSLPGEIRTHLADVRQTVTATGDGAKKALAALSASAAASTRERRRQELGRHNSRRKEIGAACGEEMVSLRRTVFARLSDQAIAVRGVGEDSAASTAELMPKVKRAQARQAAASVIAGQAHRLGQLRISIEQGIAAWRVQRANVGKRLENARSSLHSELAAAASTVEELWGEVVKRDRQLKLREKAQTLNRQRLSVGADLDDVRVRVCARLVDRRASIEADAASAVAALAAEKLAVSARLKERSGADTAGASLGPTTSKAIVRGALLGRTSALGRDDTPRTSTLPLEEEARAVAPAQEEAAAATRLEPGSDPAREEAISNYAAFVRMNASVRFVLVGDKEDVDLESLPDEWQRCGSAFGDEEAVRAAIDAVAARRKNEEFIERTRADAAAVRGRIIDQVEKAARRPVDRDGPRWGIREGILDDELTDYAQAMIDHPDLQKAFAATASRWWAIERAHSQLPPSSDIADTASVQNADKDRSSGNPSLAPEIPDAPGIGPADPDEVNWLANALRWREGQNEK